MRKNRKRLVLCKETVAVLSNPKLLGIHGGGPTPGMGQCLTDLCSVAYCFTTGATCPQDP